MVKGSFGKFYELENDGVIMDYLHTAPLEGDLVEVVAVGVFNWVDCHDLASDFFVMFGENAQLFLLDGHGYFG